MTDGASLQAKIWVGAARAAERVGTPFTLYRPTSAGPVLVAASKICTLRAQLEPLAGFGKPNLYGAATRQLLADGSLLQPGDYLSDGTRIAFVATLEPLLPILAILCNRTVTIHRPGGAAAGGQADAGYAGNAGAGSLVLQGWPASLLQGGGSGAAAPMKLPSDPAGGGWSLLLPPVTLAGVVIAVGDQITCDLGPRYAVAGAEQSALGWRVALGEIGI